MKVANINDGKFIFSMGVILLVSNYYHFLSYIPFQFVLVMSPYYFGKFVERKNQKRVNNDKFKT